MPTCRLSKSFALAVAALGAWWLPPLPAPADTLYDFTRCMQANADKNDQELITWCRRAADDYAIIVVTAAGEARYSALVREGAALVDYAIGLGSTGDVAGAKQAATQAEDLLNRVISGSSDATTLDYATRALTNAQGLLDTLNRMQ